MGGKKKQITFKAVKYKYGRIMSRLGYSDEFIDNYYKEWSKDKIPRLNDFMWHLFNRALYENENLNLEEMFFRHKQIYYAMGIFVMEYENGNRNRYTRLAFEAELNYFLLKNEQSNLFYEVRIICGTNCEYAESINGFQRSPEDMMKWQPLASEKCINPKGCNCGYSLKILRDENDRLLKKNKKIKIKTATLIFKGQKKYLFLF
tara:strand:- start:3543 stop:4154 length:612 start_codon:yes stop_codon:yes gene_type:complete